MQFGGFDHKIVETSLKDSGAEISNTSDSPDGIYWMEINSDSHWQVLLNGVKFGG